MEDTLRELRAAITSKQYDCTCQVGGVDALSIDTDWLNAVVEKITERFAVLELAASGKDLEAAERVVVARDELSILRGEVAKWRDPEHYGYDLGKTFFAEYAHEWLDGIVV